MYMYEYGHIRICTCGVLAWVSHVSICVYIYINICTCMYGTTCIWICIHIYMCTCMYIDTYVYVGVEGLLG